jgi:hypothetical protein
MKQTLIAFFCLSTVFPRAFACENLFKKLGRVERLSYLVEEKKPWETLEANSEQRQPFYIGATPREFILENKSHSRPHIPVTLKSLADRQSQILLKGIGLNEAQFEVWPYLTDEGDPNWVFARYRKNSNSPWYWLKRSHWNSSLAQGLEAPALPELINPQQKLGYKSLFSDFLEFHSLYQKPVYQEAIWTSDRASEILGGWIEPQDKNKMQSLVSKDSTIRARILPQPARFNKAPVTFVAHATNSHQLDWSSADIVWDATLPTQRIFHSKVEQLKFSPNFSKLFKEDVRILSGEKEALFPISGKKMRFTRKSSAQSNNHLLDMVDYLSERYRSLGLETRRQNFTWREIPQANLITVIPGKNRNLPPLVFADHIDTAFAEDHFSKTGQRISNPGADDNATATASLLRAAEELRGKRPERDIWLVHLTGEEYPADDLGVRHFMKELMKEKTDIAGMVLIDMIGIRDPKDPIFQINSGKSVDSMELSQTAMRLSKSVKAPFKAVLRDRFNDKSYLYNTDGYILDSLGYPVVFFNEHLNRHTMGAINQHYHQTTDTSSNVDFEYATHISKIAIMTLWNGALK